MGDGGNPFQTQHPRDHCYASSTGDADDCPQPDLGLLPGPRTDWEPDPVSTNEPVLTVTNPSDGATSADGAFVRRRHGGAPVEVAPEETRPRTTTTPTDDAKASATEITALDVAIKDSGIKDAAVEAVMHVKELPPTAANGASPTSYSVTINGHRFDSFLRVPPLGAGPQTWDVASATYMPRGTSTWDTKTNTVTFRIPRDYLEAASVYEPYKVFEPVQRLRRRRAHRGRPRTGRSPRPVGVASGRTKPTSSAAPVVSSQPAPNTVNFEHPGGNPFEPHDTSSVWARSRSTARTTPTTSCSTFRRPAT